jgi:hypothetical protein
MRRWKTMLLGLALVASIATFAACGGDDEDAAPASPPAEPAEPAAEPPAEPAEAPAEEEPAAGGGTLIASVGPGFEISLTTEDGEAVTELAAGSYTIQVDDKAQSHNFHLTGGGVEETTDVGAVETAEWTVDLASGEYTFVCDPHASTMQGSFTVS